MIWALPLPDALAIAVSSAGLGLLVWRMAPGRTPVALAVGPWPRLSVIVPARNEAAQLPGLLQSLAKLTPAPAEVIVVDDRSADATAAVAQSFGATVVRGLELPPDWGGKQWACHQGASVATGEYLLFTDADTVHHPDSLARALAQLHAKRAGLVSALPYHRGQTWWERCSGPFHVVLLALTGPQRRPGRQRVYGLGQYLLFQREAYDRCGGHHNVRQALVEDLPLARLAVDRQLGYWVYRGPPLFDVRMYSSLAEFIQGWRRNFRAGFHYAQPTAGLEATLIIAVLVCCGRPSLGTVVLATVAWAFVAWRQRSLGNFSSLGVLVAPWALTLFCLVTALAAFDRVLGRRQVWKGRQRPVTMPTA